WPISPSIASCGTNGFLKQRVITSDVTTDLRWPEEYRTLAVNHGLRASWSEPLISEDGAVVGTFVMYFAEPRVPDASDLELIESVGHLALTAIQMKRSRLALRQSEEERKNVESQCKLAQARLEGYEQAVEGLEEMIVVVDREYRYLIANNAF